MRLIDADVVEDTLKKCVSNAYKRRDVQCATGVSLAILQLRNIPAAYDIEKLVDEVRKYDHRCDDCRAFNCSECEFMNLIDAIRKGGVE